MRYIVLVVSMAFMASLFVVSQGFAAGESGYGKSPEFGTSAESGAEHQGMTSEQQGVASQQGIAAHQLDNNQVRELQRILQEEGYDVGPVDGILGSQTTSALQEYQQSVGIAASGQPDEETLRSLAPDAETQEIFGLSPEFGEQDQQQPMDQQPVDQQPMEPMEEEWTPEGSESMERY